MKQNQGQVLLVVAILFAGVATSSVLAVASPTVRQLQMAKNLELSKKSYFAAEAGNEDVLYRLRRGMQVGSTENLTLDGVTVSTTVSDTETGKEIVATGDSNDHLRRVSTNVILGTGVAFHYGIQAGTGGIVMENTASVRGNVYSNGPVIGSGPLNNTVRGEVISAGSSGLFDNVYATSSVFARTIRNSRIDKDAYYQTISGTTVFGTLYPNSPNQATTSFPITDAQIEGWKANAEAGGIVTSPCPYVIDTTTTTIGPKKYNCGLTIQGNNYTVTVAGDIWVKGDLIVKNSPTIRIADGMGARGVAVIVDDPANPTSKGMISLENSAIFEGSTNPESYVLFISQNRSAESGGSNAAIDVKNTVSGDLLVYAPHGEIMLQNSIQLQEVTAYRIRLKNTAEVVYKTGIANLLFSSGPSGGYEISGWREVE